MNTLTHKSLIGVVNGHANLDLPNITVYGVTPTGTALANWYELQIYRFIPQSGGGYISPDKLKKD